MSEGASSAGSTGGASGGIEAGAAADATTAPVAEGAAQEQPQGEAGADALPPLSPEQLRKYYKHKMKIGAEEREVPFAELEKSYGMNAAADEKFKAAKREQREAMQLKEEMRQFISQLKTDPAAVLAQLDPRAYEAWVNQEMDYRNRLQQMTPEQRERWALQQELERERHERMRVEQQKQQYETSAQVQQYQRQYSEQFPKALQAAGLEVNQRTFKAMARIARDAEAAGIEWTPEQVAQAVAEEESHLSQHVRESFTKELSELEEDKLFERMRELYGDAILDRFRKADIARLQKSKAAIPQTQQQGTRAPRQQQKLIRLEDLRDEMERKRG